MAKLYYGFGGPFVGKLGPAVGYIWKSRPCMRAYQKFVRYPNTEDQQKQRNWFVSMVRFASQATPALKLGLRRMADTAKMTEGNYFVMKNKEHFHRDGDSVTVDYASLQIAKGPAADVYFHAPRFESDETLVVDYEKNSLSLRASSEDDVYIYIYAPALGQGILSAPAKRRAKQLRMRLPVTWAGQEVQVYGFVIDHDGRPSNSTHIGVGRVNHYEDRGKYIPLDNNWQEFVELAHESTGESSEAVAVTTQETSSEAATDPPEVP